MIFFPATGVDTLLQSLISNFIRCLSMNFSWLLLTIPSETKNFNPKNHLKPEQSLIMKWIDLFSSDHSAKMLFFFRWTNKNHVCMPTKLIVYHWSVRVRNHFPLPECFKPLMLFFDSQTNGLPSVSSFLNFPVKACILLPQMVHTSTLSGCLFFRNATLRWHFFVFGYKYYSVY